MIAVEEQYKQFSRIGERRYTYNDTGALEHVEEQRGDSLVPWANIPPFDAPEATTVPLRVSRVVFAAGVPICAARHYAGTHRR